jgi:hypothetical protein
MTGLGSRTSLDRHGAADVSLMAGPGRDRAGQFLFPTRRTRSHSLPHIERDYLWARIMGWGHIH